jgi:hypothetical protein
MLPFEGPHVKLEDHLEFGYQFSICSTTKEKHVPVGRSQDLTETNLTLASSPALNARKQILVSVCTVTLFGKKFIYSFLKISVSSL